MCQVMKDKERPRDCPISEELKEIYRLNAMWYPDWFRKWALVEKLVRSIPWAVYTLRLATGPGAQSPVQTRVSPILSPECWPHTPPAVAWLPSARTLGIVERWSGTSTWWPSVGSKPPGVPLRRLVDWGPHCRRAALSEGNVVFLCFLLQWGTPVISGWLGSLLLLPAS